MFRLRTLLLLLQILLVACATPGPANNMVPSLTLLHLNDTYRIDAVEDGNRGGFGRVTTLIGELRQDGRDVRLLHGGDFLYPSLESQLWDGEQIVEAFNFMDALAPMYVVPGNHEFDQKTAGVLVDAVRQSEFEWIADNQRFATGEPDVDSRLRQGYVTAMGPYRVGIVGLTLHADDGGYDREYAPIDPNYVAAASKAITAMERQGADVIIGLTHLHLDDDRRLARLRKAHPKFVLIAGGHEHEPEFEPATAGTATIIKGASNARTIWRIDISGDPADGIPEVTTTRIAVDNSIAPDPAYTELADKWRNRLLDLMPYLPAKIGTAAVPLDGREVTVRNEESNWGNFIVDQMRGAYGDSDADFAFINSGTLRIDDFILGDITFEDIGRTFGFSSFLRHMTISGQDFRNLMEAGYRGTGPSKGYFPQVSGFRICIDRSRPNGERIVALQTPSDNGWQAIDDDAAYSLVAPDFLYGGGDGYDFSAARDVSRAGSELKYLVVDAIMNAQAANEPVGAPVDPDNPRIDILNDGNAHCFD